MSESRRPVSTNGGYLSIREVLDALIDAFDDITISKIRFLESRGLIHPERTPSGYRKFYPGDVERLRWILRQQRENFLPLKVIKRRLDVEDGRVPDLPDSQSLFDDQAELQDRDLALANVVSNIRQARRVPEPPENDDPDMGSAVDLPIADDSDQATRDSSASKPRFSTVSPRENGSLEGKVELHLEAASPAATRHPNHPSQVEGARPGGTRGDEASSAGSAKAIGHDVPPSAKAQPSAEGRGGDGMNELVGVTLSLDELAAAASTTPESIAELVEFGFISSQVVAGVACFDGDALIVAKAIVGLRPFGLEPRHLKSVRNSAERDASLYTQSVAPLLRQRNPEARARAKAQLEELAQRGTSLYEQILRLQIRRLGG